MIGLQKEITTKSEELDRLSGECITAEGRAAKLEKSRLLAAAVSELQHAPAMIMKPIKEKLPQSFGKRCRM